MVWSAILDVLRRIRTASSYRCGVVASSSASRLASTRPVVYCIGFGARETYSNFIAKPYPVKPGLLVVLPRHLLRRSFHHCTLLRPL